jgi:hypothetical protein
MPARNPALIQGVAGVRIGPILGIVKTIRRPPCSAQQIDEAVTLRHSTIRYLSAVACERNVESAQRRVH